MAAPDVSARAFPANGPICAVTRPSWRR